MKLEFLSFDFDKFAQEMQNLKDKKGFDYLLSEDDCQEPGLWRWYVIERYQCYGGSVGGLSAYC